jgi:hypothetical protein
MFSQNLFSREQRALILACCLFAPAWKAQGEDTGLLASALTTHNNGPSLREPTDSEPLSDEPKSSAASTDATAPAAPAAASSPDAASAPAVTTTPDASAPLPQLAANNATSSAAGAPAATDGTATPSTNVTINLINLMVKRNLITREDADGLIRQAQQEADVARAQAAATQATAQRALTAQQNAPPPAPAPAPTSGDDEVRVAYVPDVVKKQITDQVTQNVMEQTREEHLADTVAANQVPDWVKRFNVNGDVRVRYEEQFFPSGNDDFSGKFLNFNAINTSSNGLTVVPGIPANSAPQFNTDQDRTRYRLRARIGAGIDLGDGFTAGMRVATGSDNSPVTENQTFGAANSFTSNQGGDFSKYSIWLDRAFIRYEYGGGQDPEDLTFTLGRSDNPFYHTSMIWSDDVGFDGMVLQGKFKATDGVTPFLTTGAFPVYNTDLNFSSTQTAKFNSEDKYLIAVQGGTTWIINKDFSFKGAAAYYDFENIQGQVSDPIPLASASAVGNTDDSRPSFAQNGNTYIALRNFTDPNPADVQNQYFGLASPFHEFAVTAGLDFSHFDPFHISLTGEFVQNLAFDRNAILNNGPAGFPGPQNNTTNGNADSFNGGDSGYLMRLDLGKVALEKLWDWNLQLSYRYVESDATVDGFTDSDFGGSLTGTNLKGYTIGGNLAFSKRVWIGLRWMSAEAIAGPTYKNDLIQFDVNAKF